MQVTDSSEKRGSTTEPPRVPAPGRRAGARFEQPRPREHGDPGEAGRELVRLTPRLRSVALRILRDREAAEDVVQTAIEKALRKHDQFDGRARFSTWLHRIVVNEALLWLRREGRRGRGAEQQASVRQLLEEPAGIADAEGRLIAAERSRALRRELERLPRAEREVLVACGLEELPQRDFARRHGVAIPTVKSRAFRARRRLQSLLAEHA